MEFFGSEGQYLYMVKKLFDVIVNDVKGRNFIFIGGID